METFEGQCVHKDYGVVSFINDGRAMRIEESGSVVIFNKNDKMKLRPLVLPEAVKRSLVAMQNGMSGRTIKSEWKDVCVGDEFYLLCKVVGEMNHSIKKLNLEEKKLLQKLKKHIDLELSFVYPSNKR